MNIIRGAVTENLLPIVLVSVEKEGSAWAELDMLLDTGFDGEVALYPSHLNEHCLVTEPGRQSLPPDEALEHWDLEERTAPYKSKVLWPEHPVEISLRLLSGAQPAFAGILGTALLRNRYVTVNVTRGGVVIVERAASRPEPRRALWKPRRRTGVQIPFGVDNEDEYWRWSEADLPWTVLSVQDCEGKYRHLWVTVDTGYNGELSLPASCVTRLGLTLSGASGMKTTRGIETVNHVKGKVNVKWHGEERPVDCQQWEGHPPLVGMELLEGSRVTMDFSFPRPRVEISRNSNQRGWRRASWIVMNLLRRL